MDKILLVDDDPDFLGLIQSILKSEFDVQTAKSAIDGLALVKTEEYSAIILDVSLPDYTGYYLGKLIRKDHPNLPIAFLTNYDGDITRENATDVGAELWKKSDVVSSLSSLGIYIRKLYE